MGSETTPTTPSAAENNSFLARVDPKKIYAMAQEAGYAFTEEERTKFEAMQQRWLGEFNGGSVSGGIYGMFIRLFRSVGSFLQNLVGGGKMAELNFDNLGDALKDAGTATTPATEHFALQQATMNMYMGMRSAGGNLAAMAERVTGQRMGGSGPVQDDPNSIYRQILAGIPNPTAPGTAYLPPNGGSLNMNPDYQPTQVATNSPPLGTPVVPQGTSVQLPA